MCAEPITEAYQRPAHAATGPSMCTYCFDVSELPWLGRVEM